MFFWSCGEYQSTQTSTVLLAPDVTKSIPTVVREASNFKTSLIGKIQTWMM